MMVVTNHNDGSNQSQISFPTFYICQFVGVIDQVDDALAAEEEIRLNKVLEKEMKAIQDDVRYAKYFSRFCDLLK